MRRIGVLCTHPVQYLSPLFAQLSQQSDLHVHYCTNPDKKAQGKGFGVEFAWNVPLLEGYSHEFLPASPLKRAARIQQSISDRHFDLMILFGWSFAAAREAVRACLQTRTRVAVRGDSQLPAKPAWVQELKRPFYRPFLSQFDAFLSPGKRFEEYLRFFGVESSRIFQCPHAVDNDFFETHAEEALSKKSHLHSPETPVFLYCGKFIPKKRPMDFLKAIERFEKGRVRAILVGDGPLGPALKSYAKERALPVSFTGFVNQADLPAVYASADCLTLCSDGGETWGLVVNEAMASGIPAIVSDTSGCAPDLIECGRTGYTYTTGRPESLHKQMIRFITERSKTDFKQNARQKIAHYSISEACKGILRALPLQKESAR